MTSTFHCDYPFEPGLHTMFYTLHPSLAKYSGDHSSSLMNNPHCNEVTTYRYRFHVQTLCYLSALCLI